MKSEAKFVKGMGVGLVVGSAIGMAVAPKKKSSSRTSMVSKALKTMGEVIENVSDAIGF